MARWRIAFYWQRRWAVGFRRIRSSVRGVSKYDSPARSVDSILNVGPLHCRIYREVGGAGPEGGTQPEVTPRRAPEGETR
jgi:hypothetical protein